MTRDPSGRDDDRPAPAATTSDDERPVDRDQEDEVVPDELDLAIETPVADAIDQRHAEHFDDDME